MQQGLSSKSEQLKTSFLVLRAQVGDDSAFAELYRKFGSRTLRLLSGLLKSDEAQDLNQEVWLTVYRRIASLEDALRFRTWLFQISRNRALDHFRSTKRLDELQDILNTDSEEATLHTDDVLEVQSRDLIERVLEKLSPRLREAIVLNYFEGMDYEEMALILGVSLGTVKSRIYNAKKSIRTFITK